MNLRLRRGTVDRRVRETLLDDVSDAVEDMSGNGIRRQDPVDRDHALPRSVDRAAEGVQIDGARWRLVLADASGGDASLDDRSLQRDLVAARGGVLNGIGRGHEACLDGAVEIERELALHLLGCCFEGEALKLDLLSAGAQGTQAFILGP